MSGAVRLVERLKPDEEDYFVLKPKHSGFFSTTLEILLNHLKTNTVVLTGIAGNICVLFTANDAYMRDFQLVVPSDCVASNSDTENQHALNEMHDPQGRYPPLSRVGFRRPDPRSSPTIKPLMHVATPNSRGCNASAHGRNLHT